MKVQWEGLNSATWDSAHTQACAPLQQDWAYGASMQMIGVTVLRALVEDNGKPVALAQFILRRWGSVLSMALCSRGPVWLQALSAQDKAHVHARLRKSLPLKGLRMVLITPEEERSDSLGLSHWRRVMTGYATVMLLAARHDGLCHRDARFKAKPPGPEGRAGRQMAQSPGGGRSQRT